MIAGDLLTAEIYTFRRNDDGEWWLCKWHSWPEIDYGWWHFVRPALSDEIKRSKLTNGY